MNLEEIRARYTAPEIPPCRVCGKPLSLGACENGRNLWYCDAAGDDLRHWQQSEYRQTQFQDDDVLKLCDEAERLQSLLDAEIASNHRLSERELAMAEAADPPPTLSPLACHRCAMDDCPHRGDDYNNGCEPGIDCLAAK